MPRDQPLPSFGRTRMARKPSFPRRGTVYRVGLDPAIGHELRKTRPAVVVSNNHMNGLCVTIASTYRLPYSFGCGGKKTKKPSPA